VPGFADHVYQGARVALESISTDERSDIYVISFFVYDEADDPRRPTVTVGYNTESDVTRSAKDDPFPTDEARWNYAFWRQNELALICGSSADPVGAQLREEWERSEGLWYELAEGEPAAFNERGEPLTKAFVTLLEGVVRRLHSDDLDRIFGRSLAVLIHELEYHDEIAAQNLRANPPGIVPDGFVRWCQGG